jgi:hypothetical protein
VVWYFGIVFSLNVSCMCWRRANMNESPCNAYCWLLILTLQMTRHVRSMFSFSPPARW